MTQREQLEWAAKACGLILHMYEPHGKGSAWVASASASVDEYGDVEGLRIWQPDTDQADSDKMACDLEIDTSLFKNPPLIVCAAWSTDGENHFEEALPHDNTIEGRRSAVREARLLVAAEIGRAMP